MKFVIFAFIFGLWAICFFVLIVFYSGSKNKINTKTELKRVFGRDPDCLTLKKWIRVQKEKPGFFEDYVQRVSHSSIQAQNETIVFVGLIRNHGKESLDFWFPLLENIGSYFKDYKVIFVENDSEDDTRNRILSLTRKNNHYDIFCPGEDTWNTSTCNIGTVSSRDHKNKNKNLQERISVLSILRESYIAQIKNMENVDFVMMIDWDLKGDFSMEGFFHALSVLRESERLDGVAVNSFHKENNSWLIFDTFPLFPSYQCREIVRKPGALDKSALKKYNKVFLEAIHPIYLPSAFGGMSIYKHESLVRKDPHYDVWDGCPYRCEHTVFQKNLEMALDPWFLFLIYKNMH